MDTEANLSTSGLEVTASPFDTEHGGTEAVDARVLAERNAPPRRQRPPRRLAPFTDRGVVITTIVVDVAMLLGAGFGIRRLSRTSSTI